MIIVAKTDAAHEDLACRPARAERIWLLTSGRFDRDADRVNGSIGQHPTHREKVAVRPDHPDSRPAETFFEVMERLPGFARCGGAARRRDARHQIRVHLDAPALLPVLCDKQYGGRLRGLTLGESAAVTRQKRLGGDAAGRQSADDTARAACPPA